MQLAWSRIWTRVTVSISYDDNDYTTDTSNKRPSLILTSLAMSHLFFSSYSVYEMGGKWQYSWWSAASKIYLKQLVEFLSSSHLDFTPVFR